MTLTEMIQQFETSHLRRVFTRLAGLVYDFPKHLASRPEGGDRFYEKGWKTYEGKWKGVIDIRRIYLSNSPQTYAEQIEKCLQNINEARVEQILSKINKTSIQIDNQDHIHAALVFGYIPKQDLEEVAIANNISIPEGISSGFGAFFSGSERDSAKWALVAKMAAEVSGYEQEIEFSLLCPHCEKDNPTEADHCIYCGGRIRSAECTSCKSENPPQAKFCMECGEGM